MRLPPHISKIKRKNIKEALKIWNSKPRETYQQRQSFCNEMVAQGWEDKGGGCYKQCLVKDSIAVKYIFSPDYKEAQNEIERELQQWEQAPYQFRRHLPTTYALHKGLMIQDRVLVKCNDGPNCEGIKEARKKFRNHLYDYAHNHGHTIKGTVKFFDWVYNRSWDRVHNNKIQFLAK